MKVALIGGGWAGLAAALRLHELGHTVVLHEAARTLGGRARRVHARALNCHTDNGQHLLLGAYTETLGAMRSLGLEPDTLFHRMPLQLESADGKFALSAARLPAPLHLLAGIVQARGLGFAERLRLIAIVRRLEKAGWRTPPAQTVEQWLAYGRQSPHAIRSLWQPLCIAALNTPPENASAQLFANVLRDSLGSAKQASDLLIPKVDLTQLWPEALERRLLDDKARASHVLTGCTVRRLHAADHYVEVEGKRFDAVVVAGNVPSSHRLLAQLPPSEEGAAYLASLAAFTFLPIATISLRLSSPWRLPSPMLLLRDNAERQQFGQWLFDASALNIAPPSHHANSGHPHVEALLHVVVSDARAMQEHAPSAVIAGLVTQLQEQTARYGPMPQILGHNIIVEKRATFAAVPHLRRPSNKTPWTRVWVAGDWTDTAYPAVLEGAVRSGNRAALEIHAALAA